MATRPTFRQPTELDHELAALRAEAPAAAVKIIESSVGVQLVPFQLTIRSPHILDAVRKAVLAQAFRDAAQGLDGDVALRFAYDIEIGRKFDIHDAIRAPKGRIDEVLQATDAILTDLRPDHLPGGDSSDSAARSRHQTAYFDGVMRGHWQVSCAGDGVVRTARFDGSEVSARLADGSLIEFSYAAIAPGWCSYPGDAPVGKRSFPGVMLSDLEVEHRLDLPESGLRLFRDRLGTLGFPEPIEDAGFRWDAAAVWDWSRAMRSMGKTLPTPTNREVAMAKLLWGRRRARAKGS